MSHTTAQRDPELVADILRVIQTTADKAGNVTMLQLAENIAQEVVARDALKTTCEVYFDSDCRREGDIVPCDACTSEVQG